MFLQGVDYLTPNLENVLQNHEYEGIFEIHVTVENVDVESQEKFRNLCGELSCKAVMIELPSGQVPKQLMTASYHSGTLRTVIKDAFKLAQKIAHAGFKVTRVKVEAMISNKGVPESEEEALKLPKTNYFEFHYKVLVNATQVELLTELCKNNAAKLSANAFKKLNNESEYRFVTVRMYATGRERAKARFDKVMDVLKENGFQIASSMREYAVYDSNVHLDSGWISLSRSVG